MGPIQTFEDLLGLIWRRRVLILLVSVIGALLGAWYAKSRPDIYETAAVLQVEQATVARTGAGAAENTLQIMQTIEQRLTTRDNMIALIERHGLMTDLPALSLEEKVAAMRAAIRFQSVSDVTGGGLSAIIIAAQASTAENAARIANDLAQTILDMGAEGKRASADATYSFFQSEEARIWQALTAIEAEIAAYRVANRAALPASRDARLEEASEVDSTLRQLDQELAALNTEESLIRSLQTLRSTDRRRLDDITQRKAVIAAQRDPLLSRKSALENELSSGAEVDRALTAYERQQRQLQDQYTVVSQRLAEAETARRLAENQQTERFALLERAIIPEYPVGSGGKRIAIAGAVASVGLALSLAFLLDLLFPAIRTSGQLERELNLRPIVSIPDVKGRTRINRKSNPIQTLVQSESGRLSGSVRLSNTIILAAAMVLSATLIYLA